MGSIVKNLNCKILKIWITLSLLCVTVFLSISIDVIATHSPLTWDSGWMQPGKHTWRACGPPCGTWWNSCSHCLGYAVLDGCGSAVGCGYVSPWDPAGCDAPTKPNIGE